MRLILALLVAGLAGCSLFIEDDSELGLGDYDDYLDQRATLVAELDRLIGEAEADAPEACRVVLFGDKPCGGHWDARVYSATASDPGAVEALADEITDLDRDAIRRFGLASDCSVTPTPRATFEDGRCLARYGG